MDPLLRQMIFLILLPKALSLIVILCLLTVSLKIAPNISILVLNRTAYFALLVFRLDDFPS